MVRTAPTLGSILALALAFGVRPVSGQSSSCGDRAWSSIGVAAFHCPGGTCVFTDSGEGGEPEFRFTTEPWLRGIDPAGPARGQIEEGDVLVAVDRLLITSAAGGRALANLREVSAPLTLRRGDRLIEVEIDPTPACESPLILVGNRFPMPPQSAGPDDTGDRIDYTVPRKVGPSALDLSLGLGLRCPGCELTTDGRARWRVPAPPIVELVERAGVAEEAGLRPGDRILEIDGHDVTRRRGGELLHAMPRGDFDITYDRDGELGTAHMNRRIVVQHIVINGDRSVRIRQGGDGGRGPIAAVSDWLRGLLGRAPGGGSDGVERAGVLAARGETWGPTRLGALLGAEGGRLFEVDADGAIRLVERPRVVRVGRDSPAAAAGLRPGDTLTFVDDYDVRSAEAARLLFRAEAGRPLALRYVREGRERRTTLTPEEKR
jgi:hypothetical protein